MKLAVWIAGALLLFTLALWAEEAMTVDLAKAPEACSLVSKEDVQTIAGEAIADPVAEKGAQNDKVKATMCRYASADGMKSMSLMFRLTNAGDNDPVYAKQTLKDSGMPVEDVTGVGDAAFYAMMQFQAFKGKHVQIAISVFGFENPKEKATSLAKKAIEKLGAAGL